MNREVKCMSKREKKSAKKVVLKNTLKLSFSNWLLFGLLKIPGSLIGNQTKTNQCGKHPSWERYKRLQTDFQDPKVDHKQWPGSRTFSGTTIIKTLQRTICLHLHCIITYCCSNAITVQNNNSIELSFTQHNLICYSWICTGYNVLLLKNWLLGEEF